MLALPARVNHEASEQLAVRSFMIAGSFGAYAAISARDHEAADSPRSASASASSGQCQRPSRPPPQSATAPAGQPHRPDAAPQPARLVVSAPESSGLSAVS